MFAPGKKKRESFGFDLKKFEALVHYICDLASDNPAKLGAIKLNKILHYCDLQAYVQFGKPITGAIYVKQKLGPTPRFHDLSKALNGLKAAKKLAIREPDVENGTRQFFSLKKPDISGFPVAEIAIINQIFNIVFNDFTARQISGYSHGTMYELCEMGQEMPYYLIYVERPGEITDEDIAWAAKHAKSATA